MSTVQAIQFIHGNAQEIAEFVGGTARYMQGRLQVVKDKPDGGMLYLYVRDGEFVIKQEDGVLDVMTARAFNAAYMNETEAKTRELTSRLHMVSSGDK